MTELSLDPRPESRIAPRALSAARTAIVSALEKPAATRRVRVRETVRLAPVPESCERARAFLAGVPELADWSGLTEAQLLVSELVANSVTHAGLGADERILLEVVVRAGRLRIEVTDPGAGFFPGRRGMRAPEFGGWGLRLVDQLSRRWGVLRDHRTHVWFELALAD